MKAQRLLHMNGGEGVTSYAKNSESQGKQIEGLKALVEEAIKRQCCAGIPERINIADLGCASGPNALAIASLIVDAVHKEWQLLGGNTLPQLVLHLNDLPGNDFDAVFKTLPDFYDRLNEEKGDGFASHCFVFAVPGSFYGRLFPCKSMHIICSSMCLHWLSQVPAEVGLGGRTSNKGNVWIGRTSSSSVIEAYEEQFRKDFTCFLESRSKEIVSGGQVILTLMGRATRDPTNQGHYNMGIPLQDSLDDMVARGLIEEGKVDSFNMPYYAPNVEELREIIQNEGSFHISRHEEVAFQLADEADEDIKKVSTKKRVNMCRAIMESLLTSHFGDGVMDELFLSLEKFLYKYELECNVRAVLVVSLVRRETN